MWEVETVNISLKEIREKKGLTVDEVSAATGLSKQMLWNYESGRRNPTPEQLCVIADFLDVSLDMLEIGRAHV